MTSFQEEVILEWLRPASDGNFLSSLLEQYNDMWQLPECWCPAVGSRVAYISTKQLEKKKMKMKKKMRKTKMEYKDKQQSKTKQTLPS